jgi:hypothetical protein
MPRKHPAVDFPKWSLCPSFVSKTGVCGECSPQKTLHNLLLFHKIHWLWSLHLAFPSHALGTTKPRLFSCTLSLPFCFQNWRLWAHKTPHNLLFFHKLHLLWSLHPVFAAHALGNHQTGDCCHVCFLCRERLYSAAVRFRPVTPLPHKDAIPVLLPNTDWD